MPGNTNQGNRSGKQPANKAKDSKATRAKDSKPNPYKPKPAPKPVAICRAFRYHSSCSFGPRCRFLHTERTQLPPSHAHAGDSPVQQFLQLFPGHDPRRAAKTGFHAEYRLLRAKLEAGWSPEEKAAVDADYDDMLVELFSFIFGDDAEDLGAWKELCRLMRLGEPLNVADARLRVGRAYFDLVAVLDASFKWDDHAPKCRSVKEKREQMTRRGGVEFPRHHPWAGELLEAVQGLQVGAAPRLSKEDAMKAKKEAERVKKEKLVEGGKMKKGITRGKDGSVGWGWVPKEEGEKKKKEEGKK